MRVRRTSANRWWYRYQLAPSVERDQEEIPSIEVLERALAAIQSGDRIAQGPGQPIEDAGPQEESAHVVRLSLQHFLGEVVDDEAIVSSETRDEVVDVVPALNRQGSKLERRDPTFRPLLKHGDLVRIEIQIARLVQVFRGLVTGEAQIRGSYSTSCPCARRRASGRGGSARVVIATCADGGKRSSRNDTWSRTSLASIKWKSSSTNTTSEPTEPSSLARVVTTVSMGGDCETFHDRNGLARGRHRAAQRSGDADPESVESLSVGSSDTQTGIRSSETEANQAASRVVLPNPGGAEIRVSLACVARRNRSESRYRRTRDSRGRGT